MSRDPLSRTMFPARAHKKARTQELVNTALENARQNGYDYSTSDPEMVATDLGACDADLEGREDLAPYVRVWQQGGVV